MSPSRHAPAQAMLLVDRLGRCKLQLLLFICTGISFLCLTGSYFSDGENNPKSCSKGGNIFPMMLSVFLLFVGRGASNACFSATYVATPELYDSRPHCHMLCRAEPRCKTVIPSKQFEPLFCMILNFSSHKPAVTPRMSAPRRWVCAAACPASRASPAPTRLELPALQTSLFYLDFSP
jgi:hypothetical protein